VFIAFILRRFVLLRIYSDNSVTNKLWIRNRFLRLSSLLLLYCPGINVWNRTSVPILFFSNIETMLDIFVIGVHGLFNYSYSTVCHTVMFKRAKLLWIINSQLVNTSQRAQNISIAKFIQLMCVQENCRCL
jgi:hypothetical protein